MSVPLAGAEPPDGALLFSSAGSTPPSGVSLDAVGVGVGVHAGVEDDELDELDELLHGVAVGVGVGVPYCATDAFCVSDAMPETARPAPAVLNTMPNATIATIARRDFIDCFLRELSAACRRARCLILSSSKSVARGRPSSRS